MALNVDWDKSQVNSLLSANRWAQCVDYGSPMTAWTPEMLANYRKQQLQAKYAKVPEFYSEIEEQTLIGTPEKSYGPGAYCTSHARYVAEMEQGVVYGFFTEDNPCDMERLAEGHDFAVIAGRFIVDTWLHGWEGELKSPVLDMEDAEDQSVIRRWYGDPAKWVQGDKV